MRLTLPCVAMFVCCCAAEPADTVPWKHAIDTAARFESEGKSDDAERILLTALSGATSADSGAAALLLSHLAALCHAEMRYLDAEKYYLRSITAHQQSGAGETLALGRTLNNLAGLYWETDRPRAAEELLLRSRSIQIAFVGTADSETLLNLGLLRFRAGRWSDAETAYREALNLRDREGGELAESAIAAVRLAAISAKRRRRAAAEPLLLRARETWRRERDAAAPHVLVDLAIAYLDARRTEDALDVLKHAAATRLERAPAPTAYAVLSLYASALRKSGNKAEARVLQARAERIGLPTGQLRLAKQTVPAVELAAGVR